MKMKIDQSKSKSKLKLKLSYLALLLTLLMNASGCTKNSAWYPFLYRPPISQGNMTNPQAVMQLKTGMTKMQVENLLGSPLLKTPLSSDTWIYIYMLQEKGKLSQKKELTLYFDHNNYLKAFK